MMGVALNYFSVLAFQNFSFYFGTLPPLVVSSDFGRKPWVVVFGGGLSLCGRRGGLRWRLWFCSIKNEQMGIFV
jgi:hypothetical protein